MKTPVLIILFSSIFSFSQAQTDIEKVKERVIKELLLPEVDAAETAHLLKTLKEDGTWPTIDYQDYTREGFRHREHTANLLTLARAYKNKSSSYYKNKKVKQTIEMALKNWVDNDYFAKNWHSNQIAVPTYLVNVMLLVGDELPEFLVEKAQPIIKRAHLNASGARPGGDRIKIVGILAKNLLFLGDNQQFNEVIRIIESEIKYVSWIGAEYGYTFRDDRGGLGVNKTQGRGIQYDNSFHHRADGVNNTLSYGHSYAKTFIEWAAYTAGTSYSFSEEKTAQLIDYYLDGICKTSVYGKYPDPGAKNRSISRAGTLRAYDSETPKKLLSLSNYRKDEIQEIVDIRNEKNKPTLSHATFYWNSEHFTFQRPGFFTSVRMYSTRNFNMEVPYNSEGFLNHHRGDGVNHISVTGEEYYNIWPVYDYQKIPGTTVMQKPELPDRDKLQKLGQTDFVGAVTDGNYGASAFDFRSPHDPLIVRKSWFFFDEEYVCLGAGISCKNEELKVATTLNQALLNGDVRIFSENQESLIQKGENEFHQVDWIHHDGIGYVFPEPTAVHIANQRATGAWWRINKQADSPKEEISKEVFMAWLDHGEKPVEETYQYIVVPAISIEKLKRNKSRQNIQILSNTPEVQSVRHLGLNICQTVFYKAGTLQITDLLKLRCHSPGIVMVKSEGNYLSEISVSDPNRELRKMVLSISTKFEKEGDDFKAVWNEKEKISEITIDLPQGDYAGKSVTIKL